MVEEWKSKKLRFGELALSHQRQYNASQTLEYQNIWTMAKPQWSTQNIQDLAILYIDQVRDTIKTIQSI